MLDYTTQLISAPTDTLTLEQVIEAAYELMYGNKQPSIKFALWNAALSSQQTLTANCRMARVLSWYVESRLPDQATLYHKLHAVGGMINKNHLSALYWTEYLETTGQLDALTTHHLTDLPSQLIWREEVYRLFHPYQNGKHVGKGMAWKTISFAYQILQPLTCQLVAIDRHHLARLGYNVPTISKLDPYLQIEDEIRQEAHNNGCHLPVSIWAWYKWQSYRYQQKATRNLLDSHKDLSCRDY